MGKAWVRTTGLLHIGELYWKNRFGLISECCSDRSRHWDFGGRCLATLMQGKGSLSTHFPTVLPFIICPSCRWEEYVCVSVYNVARHSPLYVKTGVMKNIFLIGITVIYVKYFWVGTESSALSFSFILVVFMAMSTSFSTASDSEVTSVIRTGEQTLPMAAQECGAPDYFPYSHLSPFLLSQSFTRSSCSIHFQPEGKTSRQLSCYESDFKLWVGGEDFSFISHLQNKEHLFLTLAVLCWSGSLTCNYWFHGGKLNSNSQCKIFSLQFFSFIRSLWN